MVRWTALGAPPARVGSWWVVPAVLATVVAAFAGPARGADRERPKKHVLLLNSYDPVYPWAAHVVDGVRSVFDGRSDIELSIEFMDSKKVFTPAYAQLLSQVYAAKYRHMQFDLIVSSDDDALDFLRAYRDTLFPGVPVVFCGVNNFEDARIAGFSNVTGVNEARDYDRTFAWIASLRPTTRRVVFLIDQSATGKAVRRVVDAIGPRWRQRFQLSVISDVTVAELEAQLRALPSDAVVIWEMFMIDRTGRPLSMTESHRAVVAASPVPVFGLSDASVEHGCAGGYVVSGFTQGQTAARLGTQVLAGRPASEIPVVRESPNRYMVVYPEFVRFGLDVENLPPDTIVLHKPFSFYERYRSYVWAALGGMGAQSLAILILVGGIRRVTRRGRTALRESEERYRSIVDSAEELICRFDAGGRVLFGNSALARFAGTAGSAPLQGQLYWDLVGSPAPEESQTHLDALDHGNSASALELESVHGGEHRWVLWSYRKLFTPDGRLREVQAIGRDVTGRRRAEQAVQAALQEVERGNAALARVNQHLQGVLDSMREGLLVCDRQGRLTPIQSKTAIAWFGGAAGAYVWDLLFPDEGLAKDEFRCAFEQVLQDSLPFELNVAQLPSRFVRARRVYAPSCHQVFRQGEFTEVVVSIADITQQEEQEAKDQLDRELPVIVGNLVRDRPGFQQFVDETEAMLTALAATEDGAEARRLIHTLKGTTAIYGFDYFASVCHALEDQIQHDWLAGRAGVQTLEAKWRAALARLGGLTGVDAQIMPLWRGDYDDLVARLEGSPGSSDVLATLRSWRNPRMSQVLAIHGRTVEQLARRLGKQIDAEIVDHGLRLPSAGLRPFLATLVHVIRNATDHGIESPEAREASGKTPAGHVSIESCVEQGQFVVAVEDDGRGIDWQAVRAKAQKASLPSDSPEDLVAALFTDGVSTRQEVSAISGRGIGLAAVRQHCRRLGGEVRVHSRAGQGSRFEFRFPLAAA